MVMYNYNFRIQANFRYDPQKVHFPATHPQLKRFTELLWHGYDNGYCVYKRDPLNGDIVRIDFLG